MAAALLLPGLLDRLPDRAVMLPSAGALGTALVGFAGVLSLPAASEWVWPALLVAWTLLGVAYAAVITPSGRLLRRSARAADRPAVFAAQFALSHACWLLTYPLAGWLGLSAGMVPTLLVLAAIAFVGRLLAQSLWPKEDPDSVVHEHPELPFEHPHLGGSRSAHSHPYVIDDLHSRWP
jgi:hypothetical protein